MLDSEAREVAAAASEPANRQGWSRWLRDPAAHLYLV